MQIAVSHQQDQLLCSYNENFHMYLPSFQSSRQMSHSWHWRTPRGAPQSLYVPACPIPVLLPNRIAWLHRSWVILLASRQCFCRAGQVKGKAGGGLISAAVVYHHLSAVHVPDMEPRSCPAQWSQLFYKKSPLKHSSAVTALSPTH